MGAPAANHINGNGEVIVERIYEMKDEDDLCFTSVKDEVVEEIIEDENPLEVSAEEHVFAASIKDEAIMSSSPMEDDDDDDKTNIMFNPGSPKEDHMFIDSKDDVLIDNINGGRVSLNCIDNISICGSSSIKHSTSSSSKTLDLSWHHSPEDVANPDEVCSKPSRLITTRVDPIAIDIKAELNNMNNSTLSNGVSNNNNNKKSSSSTVTNNQKVRVVSYQCTDCKTNFNKESDFRLHMEAHLIKLQNSCALCNAEFPCKSQLQEHIKEHFSKSLPHACDLCTDKFISKSGLRRHKRQMHNQSSSNGNHEGGIVLVSAEGNSSYKCHVCQAGFPDRLLLKQHTATHSSTARKPYTCEECGATFTQNGSLQVI